MDEETRELLRDVLLWFDTQPPDGAMCVRRKLVRRRIETYLARTTPATDHEPTQDEALGLLRRWEHENGNAVWIDTKAFLATLKPTPAEPPRSLCGGEGIRYMRWRSNEEGPHQVSKETWEATEYIQRGELPCPGCPKCRPCKRCQGDKVHKAGGIVIPDPERPCPHCNATGVEPGEEME